MDQKITPTPSFDCVVFGGNGDLAQRKLFPALYQRYRIGYFTNSLRIIGLSRSISDNENYRNFIKDALQKYVPQSDLDKEVVSSFLKNCYGLKLDVNNSNNWESLTKILKNSSQNVRAFYLAVTPELFVPIINNIGKCDLASENTRIILEKPIGHDYHSSIELNDIVQKVFSEKQIFRIDHYLGKETVQNLMALRFANALYEPLWNAKYIQHVEILAAEEVGVEQRGSYYDHTGALRDMVQNHLLQLLCLTAMEPPFSKDANLVRDEKVKILRALRPITEKESLNVTLRAQYDKGKFGDKIFPSYVEDLEKENSLTETYVALKVEIMNWRWAGIPFYLRTGKRLKSRVSEIVITFRPVPYNIFNIDEHQLLPNRLVIRLQPDEGVKQWLMIKKPGSGELNLRSLPLDMSYGNSFKERNPEAYERLLTDMICGDQTLFMRRDEGELAWRWIDDILKGWDSINQPLYRYPARSWGPKEADKLFQKNGFCWWRSNNI